MIQMQYKLRPIPSGRRAANLIKTGLRSRNTEIYRRAKYLDTLIRSVKKTGRKLLNAEERQEFGRYLRALNRQITQRNKKL